MSVHDMVLAELSAFSLVILTPARFGLRYTILSLIISPLQHTSGCLFPTYNIPQIDFAIQGTNPGIIFFLLMVDTNNLYRFGNNLKEHEFLSRNFVTTESPDENYIWLKHTAVLLLE